MSRRLLLRGARQLLTLRGPSGPRRGAALADLGIIENGAVLIEGEHVVQVGPSRRIENLVEAEGAEEIDVSGKVVLPGFVDSHTHLVYGAPRLTDYEMRLAGKSYQRLRGNAGEMSNGTSNVPRASTGAAFPAPSVSNPR